MATYLVLNTIIIALLIVVVVTTSHTNLFSRARLFCLAVLLLLTVVFDNLIIASGIVAYNPDTLSGLYIGLAPIEDFFYTIAAVILIPYIWEKVHES